MIARTAAALRRSGSKTSARVRSPSVDCRSALLRRGSRLEPDDRVAAQSAGVAPNCLPSRTGDPAFEAGDSRLCNSHPTSDFSLREATLAPRFSQGKGQFHRRADALIFGAEGSVPFPALCKVSEGNGFGYRASLLARLSASSIMRRGVFCVVFRKASTTTTRR
jgi:hypothetical protein